MPRTAARLVFASTLLTLSGCAVTNPTASPSAVTPAIATGNWLIRSSAAQAASLPSLSGALSGSSSAITGIFHASASGACVSPSYAIPVSGSSDASGNVTLASTQFSGSSLTLSGKLSADGRSLTNAAYSVSGGACGFTAAAQPAPANVQQFAPIDGTFTGNFTDTDGDVLPISATLTQTPTSDTTGNFQLSGTGNFGQNPCVVSPASVTNSQVTGGNVSLTYADSTYQTTVAVAGTFSTDGKTLTITNWTSTGSCGTVSGTGLLSRP